MNTTPTIDYNTATRSHTITLPSCVHREIVNWENGAQAALHSILAALKYPNGSEYWLKEAARQLREARKELKGQCNS